MSRVGRLGRVGVVANPCAGGGPDVLRAVLVRLFERLRDAEIVVNEETFEAAAADACGLRCAKAHGPAGDARRLTEALVAARVETVIGIGGDGTLGQMAEALVAAGSRARLLGIGIGSSNVGPLVGADLEGLERLLASTWTEAVVHALDVRVDGKRVGLAFHDATAAGTYFGTRDGRRVDLDAAAALRGADRTAEPASVCNAGTWIAKNGRRHLAEEGMAGGQVVASPLNDVDACRGKAVSGFLCWGPYVGCRGVVAVASSLMIRTRLSREDLLAAEPLRLFHLGLAPGDSVELGGLPEGAVAVVDGTPVAPAGPDRVLSFEVVEDAVVVLRRGETDSGAQEGGD